MDKNERRSRASGLARSGNDRYQDELRPEDHASQISSNAADPPGAEHASLLQLAPQVTNADGEVFVYGEVFVDEEEAPVDEEEEEEEAEMPESDSDPEMIFAKDASAETDYSKKRGRVKRPRHCVYCLRCGYLMDKVVVAEYCARQGLSSIVDCSWRRRGKDHYMPIAEDACEICDFETLIRLSRKLGFVNNSERYAREFEAFKRSGTAKQMNEVKRRDFAYHKDRGHFPGNLSIHDVGLVALAKSFFDVSRLPSR